MYKRLKINKKSVDFIIIIKTLPMEDIQEKDNILGGVILEIQ
jgi:hypothetical protein